MEGTSDYIRRTTPRREILAQLAEECAELGQAALKLRRTLNPDDSPTNVTEGEAEIRFREEVADVLLCIGIALDNDVQVKATLDITSTMIYKRERWAKRLREANGDE